jgi:hypothetical protein
MSVELLKFTPKTEKVSIIVVSRFCLSICRKRPSSVFLVVNVMVRVLIIISICMHFYFQTCVIAKDTSVRNTKYVNYIGHIQYLHDYSESERSSFGAQRHEPSPQTNECDCCSGTVWHFTIGVVFLAGAAICVVLIHRIKHEVVFNVHIFLCAAIDVTGFKLYSIFFYIHSTKFIPYCICCGIYTYILRAERVWYIRQLNPTVHWIYILWYCQFSICRYYARRWGSPIRTATRLRAGRSGVLIQVNVQTGSGAHPASCLVGTQVPSRGYSDLSVKLTIHLHSVEAKNEWSYVSAPPCFYGTGERRKFYLYT